VRLGREFAEEGAHVHAHKGLQIHILIERDVLLIERLFKQGRGKHFGAHESLQGLVELGGCHHLLGKQDEVVYIVEHFGRIFMQKSKRILVHKFNCFKVYRCKSYLLLFFY